MTRQPWIDGAKGLSMLLVVLFHSSGWFERVSRLGETAWLDVSEMLVPLRMPLFFMISGILASSMLRTNPEKTFRVAVSLYSVYLFWTTLHAMRLLAFPGISPETPFSGGLVFWNALTPTLYWYIWALPLYYIVTSLIFRRGDGATNNSTIRDVVVLTVAASVSLFSKELGSWWNGVANLSAHVEHNYVSSVLRNFLWFVAGCIYAPKLMQKGSEIRRGNANLLVGAGLIGVGLVAAQIEPVLTILVAPLLLITGAILIMIAIEGSAASRLCEYIGRNTLPIYIFHWLLLMVLTLATRLVTFPELPAWSGWVAPLIIMSFLISSSLIAAKAIRLVGLGVLLTGVPNGWTKQKKPSAV